MTVLRDTRITCHNVTTQEFLAIVKQERLFTAGSGMVKFVFGRTMPFDYNGWRTFIRTDEVSWGANSDATGRTCVLRFYPDPPPPVKL